MNTVTSARPGQAETGSGAILSARLARWAPPIRQPQFWVVQALVVAVAAGHDAIEVTRVVELGSADFVPVSLYLLPVVYAAVAFGLRGSAPTAMWCAALTIPNIFLWHAGPAALGELWQAGLVVAVGIFIGQRVDRERNARTDAERRERERRASEEKYHGVFESAADAILLVDPSGAIQEANAAAGRLLGRTPPELRGCLVSQVVPSDLAAIVSGRVAPYTVGSIPVAGGAHSWIEPVLTKLTDATGQPSTLALLRDVSPQVERQQLLEDYARQTVAAREEERRRIARELHDGPLQSLVQVWRSLDALTAAGDPAAGEALATARATTEAVASELRRFSRDLRPSVLDDLGLAAAFRAEAAALEGRAGISARFLSSGDVSGLSDELELTLLRICQEALRNIERHARASRVSVQLLVNPSTVRLVVTDNGHGIGVPPAPGKLLREGKLGLVGMQERARLAGGTCEIRGTRAGTTMRVSVPRQP